MRMLFYPVIVACALLLATDSDAAVRRCVSADGITIFTDRPCEYFDAQDVVAPVQTEKQRPLGAVIPQADQPLSSYGRVDSDCARTPEALVFNLQTFLQHHDTNGLAGMYHWSGMGKYGARGVMDQLEMLATQADGSVELIYPEAAFVVFNPHAYPGLPPEDPIGVRVPLFAKDAFDQAPRHARVLNIIRHAGCWWLHF